MSTRKPLSSPTQTAKPAPEPTPAPNTPPTIKHRSGAGKFKPAPKHK
jgi:hypothetical protein